MGDALVDLVISLQCEDLEAIRYGLQRQGTDQFIADSELAIQLYAWHELVSGSGQAACM